MRNKSHVEHEILSTTADHSSLFLLTLSTLPSSTLFIICWHQLQLKQLLKVLLKRVAAPWIQGELWRPCGVHSCGKTCTYTHFKSHKTVFLLAQCAERFQLDFDSTLSSGNNKQRCRFFCTFSPCNQKASIIHPQGCPDKMLG